MPTRVRSPGLYARLAGLIREVGKFGVVGAICYGIDTGLFNVVLALTDEPFGAKTVSTVVAATIAFLGNRYWTWRHRDRTRLHREYGRYFFFNLVGLGISFACLWVSWSWLGSMWPEVFRTTLATNISANVVGVGLASLFRFWAYRRFVFPLVTSATVAPEAPEAAKRTPNSA